MKNIVLSEFFISNKNINIEDICQNRDPAYKENILGFKNYAFG